jgi:hypothetical protein
MRLVLDAEAVNALLDPRGRDRDRNPCRVVPGAGRNQALDALLARESGDGLLLRDTGRTLARLIEALLAEARASSALFADAHPIAVGGRSRWRRGPDRRSR